MIHINNNRNDVNWFVLSCYVTCVGIITIFAYNALASDGILPPARLKLTLVIQRMTTTHTLEISVIYVVRLCVCVYHLQIEFNLTIETTV